MKFTLTVLPEGRMILSNEDQIESDVAESLQGIFEHWRKTPEGVLIIANCRLQHASSVEIDLPVPV